MLTTILFLAGLVLLIGGAEVLIRGASRLAAALGVSPLIIGLTVVAFGTSAPELAISLKAAFVGQANIAVGNVVGSNICNLLLILGVSAMLTPLAVSLQLIRLEVPLVVGVSVLAWCLGLDGRYGRLDGALLFGGLLIYLVVLTRMSRRESSEVVAEYTKEFGDADAGRGPRRYGLRLAQIVVGVAMLVLGARWLVGSAVVMARWLGISELVIGLTVIAVGTSLPEIVTSIMAALRQERDIAVGNIIGSNLFNILAVLGLSSLLAPDGGLAVSGTVLRVDMPIMIAVAVACFPIVLSGHRITRGEGVLFFTYYVLYVVYLVLDATSHAVLPGFLLVMGTVALPLTAVVLLVLLVQGLRQRVPVSA